MRPDSKDTKTQEVYSFYGYTITQHNEAMINRVGLTQKYIYLSIELEKTGLGEPLYISTAGKKRNQLQKAKVGNQTEFNKTKETHANYDRCLSSGRGIFDTSRDYS